MALINFGFQNSSNMIINKKLLNAFQITEKPLLKINDNLIDSKFLNQNEFNNIFYLNSFDLEIQDIFINYIQFNIFINERMIYKDIKSYLDIDKLIIELFINNKKVFVDFYLRVMI